MSIHKNARTTPNRRSPACRKAPSGRNAALHSRRRIHSQLLEVFRSLTVRKWLRRHESEGVAGLEDRTSRPHRLRTRVTSAQIMPVEALRRPGL